MASSQEFVDFVCEQLRDAGMISSRKMFGEYAIYLNGKIVALICDNQFFLKKTDVGKEMLQNVTEAPPYPGAKPQFLIDDLEDREFLCALIRKTYEELPEPKPKKPKTEKKAKETKAKEPKTKEPKINETPGKIKKKQ
ncbi:TfoX/Sxy family protein [Methanolapillus millepedarum]|uniref:TfoX N-terminal domain-containing protein n=1 Tax=Methanolapillus millepedarum TaxID=3028296 RepID=A0AA97A4K7_9EURY|nr:hypothetical protein MsAc7_14940 [Methanosarcinaceae archaeon Ac7]